MIHLNKFVTIFILIGTLWSSFGADTTPTTTCVGEQFLDLLTKWRQGDDLPVPLPSLKLITLPSYEGQYGGYGIKTTFSTGEMTLMGVNDLLIDKLTTSTHDGLLDVAGIIQFPLLTITSDNYNIKGKAYAVYNLKGSGIMRIALDNVLVPFRIGFSPQGESSQIDRLRLDFTIDDVRISLADSSWPINNILNAQGLSIIMNYYNTIVESAADNLKFILDQHMTNVTTTQLLNTFIGNCTYA